MIVSKSNIASTSTVTVSPESALQDINVITDGDYSSVFTETLADSVEITFLFDEPVDIGYIAIGGSNISQKDSIYVGTSETTQSFFWATSDGEVLQTSDIEDLVVGFGEATDDTALGVDESLTLMYQVDKTDVRRVTVKVMGSGQISISEIAMGEYYEIPRGVQGGYNMPWTVPNIQSRGSNDLNSAPVNLSYEARALSTSISVPNNIMTDFDSGWYEFIKFATTNTFYALEDANRFHSYAGFNVVAAMTQNHSQTRTLGVSSVSFNALAKTTEALF